MDEKVRDYIVHPRLCDAPSGSHTGWQWKNLIQFGASPRATINLALAARACALLQGREYVTPEDVKCSVRTCCGIGFC